MIIFLWKLQVLQKPITEDINTKKVKGMPSSKKLFVKLTSNENFLLIDHFYAVWVSTSWSVVIFFFKNLCFNCYYKGFQTVFFFFFCLSSLFWYYICSSSVLNAGCRRVRKLVSLSESRTIQQRCGNFAGKIRRIRCSIKIHGFGRFGRQWLRIPKFSKFSSARKYTKLD